MHAKLINNQIEYAPINKINEDGSITFNYGEDANLLTIDGYKEILELEKPELAVGEVYETQYAENDNYIVISYTVVKPELN